MFCTECGIQLPDNSKFCSNCGKPQEISEKPQPEQTISDDPQAKKFSKPEIQETISGLDYNFLRKSMGWYLAWVVLNFGLLLIGSDGIFDGDNMGARKFWPFGRYSDFDEVNYYDITELLVYTLFPLAFLVIRSMIRTQPTESEEPDKTTDQESKNID